MNSKPSFFSKAITLIAAIFLLSVFLFGILSANAKTTFLQAINDKFTKTPSMITIGEKIMNFASLAAPLLLSLAFAALFLLSKSKHNLAPNLLLVATIVAISGIAVFACLNVYNIIEVFNIISKSNEYVGASFRSNYISILVTLISYQILLVFYAGCLANFSSAVKRTGLPSNGVLIAFGLSNALLALWHALLLIKPAKFLEDYFTKYNLDKTGFTFSEIANVICFAVMAALALSFYAHANKEQKV